MTGIYFSGTENSRYAAECFCKEYDPDSEVYSIEDSLLQSFGAEVAGGLHVLIPDSIGDEKALKRPLEKNRELVTRDKSGRAM